MISFLSARRAAALVGCAAAVSLGTVGAAQAQAVGAAPAQVTGHAAASAARFASEATSYQNAVIANAMARDPGGTRVSAGEVTWDGGAVFVRVPVSAGARVANSDPSNNPGGCPNYDFCIWTGANFDGVEGAFPNAVVWSEDNDLIPENYWVAWGDCNSSEPNGCDVGEHSWANESGYRTWLEQNQNSGREYCISNGSYNSDYTGTDETDYWVLMTINSSEC